MFCFLLLATSVIGVHLPLYPLLFCTSFQVRCIQYCKHLFLLVSMVLNNIRTESGFTVFSSTTHPFCKCIFGRFIFSPALPASLWFVIKRISLWCELRMSHRFKSHLRKSDTIALIRQYPRGITFFVVISIAVCCRPICSIYGHSIIT